MVFMTKMMFIVPLIVLWVSIPCVFSQQHEFPLGDEVIFPNPNAIDTYSEMTGELRQWHKVTLVIDGPKASQFGETLLVVDEENAI